MIHRTFVHFSWKANQIQTRFCRWTATANHVAPPRSALMDKIRNYKGTTKQEFRNQQKASGNKWVPTHREMNHFRYRIVRKEHGDQQMEWLKTGFGLTPLEDTGTFPANHNSVQYKDGQALAMMEKHIDHFEKHRKKTNYRRYPEDRSFEKRGDDYTKN